MSLIDAMGNFHTSHDQKAVLLWEAYRDCLGTLDFTEMHFDLSSLLNPSNDLDWLELCFFREEIDKIIVVLPSNKSTGPDGFNGVFLKKCCVIIAQDFYDLCQGFWDRSINFQSINSFFITLVPKKDNPSLVGDFRPISLLNSSIKLITKILVYRLQKVIIPLIHKNQYGFIKERSIQDCLAWSFEYLHLCHS